MINVCLAIMHHFVINQMYHENKDAVLDNLSAKEKRIINTIP